VQAIVIRATASEREEKKKEEKEEKEWGKPLHARARERK